MAISEHDRHRLHTRLEETLGPEEATTLMSHLPPVGWADVATKDDLLALERVVRADIRTEAANLRTEFHLAFGSHRGDTERTLNAFRDDLATYRSDTERTLNAFRDDLATHRSDTERTLNAFRAEFKGDLASLKHEWNGSFASFKDELHADRRSAQRQVILALVVALLSLVITFVTG